MRIDIDRPLCTALLKNCVLVAPTVFEIDADGKAIVKDPNGGSEGLILRAALACQQRAVVVTEDDGTPIWPGDFRAFLARLDALGRD